MKVPTIEMRPEEARAEAARYEAAVKLAESRRSPLSEHEQQQLARDRKTLELLQSVGDGRKLLDLHEAIRRGGLKPDGTPALAVAKADWTECFFRPSYAGQLLFQKRRREDLRWKPIALPASLLPGVTDQTLRAVVPSIPPRHRPGGRELRGYRILWEAEWKGIPRDPMLLKHIAGPLHVVLAVWDLTDLERAVLEIQEEERR